MNRLDRYIAGEILKLFGLFYLGIAFLFLVVDYLTNLDEFFASGVSGGRFLYYVLLKLPFFSGQLIPICLLLAVILAIGFLNRNREMVALRAGGLSPVRILRPVFAVALLVCMLDFGVAETVAPVAMKESNAIKFGEIRKSSVSSGRRENIWIRRDRRFIHIGQFDARDGVLKRIEIRELHPDRFAIQRTVRADTAKFVPGGWQLSGVTLESWTAGGFISTKREGLPFPVDIVKTDFETVENAAQEMGIFELHAYAEKIREEGYDATIYQVDLQGKIAFPFAILIFAMLGIWIGQRPGMRTSLAGGVALGLGAAFFYWIAYSFGLSLGYGALLPAIVAAWLPNFAFTLVALFGLLGTEQV